jgi:hypothetical protein
VTAKKRLIGSRLKRSTEDSRVDRVYQTRAVKKNRKLSDSKRLDMFRKQFFQSSLPDLPKIPGFHVCWLTTTNPRDTIHNRMRLGYTPIKTTEVPGYEQLKIKSGEHAGHIGVNEMIAFKIPLRLYEQYMRESHHIQPAYEEGKLRQQIEEAEEDLASQGLGKHKVRITEEEGNAELGKARKAPRFRDLHGES